MSEDNGGKLRPRPKFFTPLAVLAALAFVGLIGVALAVSRAEPAQTTRPDFDPVLVDHFGLNPDNLTALTDYERGRVDLNTEIYNGTHSEDISSLFGPKIADQDSGPNYNFDPGEGLAPFEFEIEQTADGFIATYDPELYFDGRQANFYFEIDNSPTFDSPLATRYPNLQQTYVTDSGVEYEWDIFNPQDIVLDLFRTSTREMFDPGVFELPFSDQVYLASFPENRDDIGMQQMEQIAHLLGQRESDIANHSQVFNFVKLNQIWSGDTVSRKPLESFVAKAVACGHMNGVAGLLIELAGDRYRIVGGFDPYVRPHLPGGGHSAVEVYSDETGDWSYLDTFLDVYLPGVSVAELQQEPAGETVVYERPILGEDYTMTLQRLFQFRSYGDLLGRRALTPMTFLADAEDTYGLGWATDQIRAESIDLINDEATIYIRGRYARSNCPLHILDDPGERCDPSGVQVSEWTVNSYTIGSTE